MNFNSLKPHRVISFTDQFVLLSSIQNTYCTLISDLSFLLLDDNSHLWIGIANILSLFVFRIEELTFGWIAITFEIKMCPCFLYLIAFLGGGG